MLSEVFVAVPLEPRHTHFTPPKSCINVEIGAPGDIMILLCLTYGKHFIIGDTA